MRCPAKFVFRYSLQHFACSESFRLKLFGELFKNCHGISILLIEQNKNEGVTTLWQSVFQKKKYFNNLPEAASCNHSEGYAMVSGMGFQYCGHGEGVQP